MGVYMIPLISFFISCVMVYALLTDLFSRTVLEYHKYNGTKGAYFKLVLLLIFCFFGVWKIIEILILISQIVHWLFTGSYN